MSNLNLVKSIGAGIRKAENATESIVATLPDGFDHKARGAVAELVHSWACGESERPPVKIGAAGSQKATDYGRGVDALVKSVKRALSTASDDAPVMRVSLKGTGSAVVPEDHPAYALLLALLAGDASDEATVTPIAA